MPAAHEHHPVASVKESLSAAADDTQQAYARDADDERPLRGYVALMAAYGALVGGVAVAARAKGLPRRLDPWDVALLGMATQRLTRTLTKDAVTSPLRAPFTRYVEPSAPGEVHEDVRGEGWRHAVGELVTCPFCLAQWVATTLVAGHVVAPRAARLVTATLAVVGVSDLLQYAYAGAQKAGS